MQREPDQKLQKKQKENSVEMDKTFLVGTILFTLADMACLRLNVIHWKITSLQSSTYTVWKI